jgi:hypothetical protein
VAKQSEKSGSEKPKRGGARKGAGRKPKAATVLRDKLIAGKSADAEAAYAVFVKHMGSNDVPTQLECAREVMNRVWGKPHQAIQLDHSGGVTTSLADEDRKLLDGLKTSLGDSLEAKVAAADALLHAAQELERGNPG